MTARKNGLKTGSELTKICFSVTKITGLGTPVTLSNQADARLISSRGNLAIWINIQPAPTL